MEICLFGKVGMLMMFFFYPFDCWKIVKRGNFPHFHYFLFISPLKIQLNLPQFLSQFFKSNFSLRIKWKIFLVFFLFHKVGVENRKMEKWNCVWNSHNCKVQGWFLLVFWIRSRALVWRWGRGWIFNNFSPQVSFLPPVGEKKFYTIQLKFPWKSQENGKLQFYLIFPTKKCNNFYFIFIYINAANTIIK